MALVQCRHCRRAFISAPQDKDFCPNCAARLHKIYPVVRGYLRDHERTIFTLQDVSDALDIDIQDVKGLVTMGLIDSYGGGGKFW